MRKAHRAGVREGFLIRHKLRLTDLNSDNVDVIRSRLDTMTGVDAVALDNRSGILDIAYDASQHDIDEVIGSIRGCGADISHSWWQRIKLGWIRQIDQNIKDNAAHEPHCCNRIASNIRGPEK